MNKSSLSILNFKALYNIFFETKNFHNFNLYEYRNEQDLIEGLKNIEDTFQDCEFKIKRANDGGAVVVRRNYHEKN